MARYIYRPRHPRANKNGMVLAELVAPAGVDPHVHVIRDEMPATRHMATGEYFTSKAKFRQQTRASGCVEAGNDASLTRPRKPITLDRTKRRDDIRQAIYEVRNRVRY